MDSSISELIGRIRVNEARMANIRERLLVTDNNSISEFRKMSAEMREVNNELKQVKVELFRLRETIRDMVKEFGNFARSQDLRVLEKYINMWSPLNFTTEKEVIRLIKENARYPAKDDKSEETG